MAKITLYIPSRIYGGAERQMAILACLAADNGHEVTLIDSKVGIVAKLLKDREDIQKVTENGSAKVRVIDSILITQASYAFCLDSMVELENTEVRFWFMHQLNLPHMYISRKLPKLLSNFFAYMLRSYYRKKLLRFSNSFYFMTQNMKETVEAFYGVQFNNDFTGLLSERKKNLELASKYDNSICWLGRLDKTSKLLVLKKILQDFSSSKYAQVGTVFHIIGDGAAREELEKYSKDLGLTERVNFLGHVEFEDLKLIISKTCILFAHGTSIYEGVYSGVPVCLVDFYIKSEHLTNMNYEFYADSKVEGFGDLITDEKDLRIRRGVPFDVLVTDAVKRRAEIVEMQSTKLEKFICLAEKRCLSLFSKKETDCINPESCILDSYFFKIRKILLLTRKKSV